MAFSPPSQMETVAPLVSVNGVHNCSAWLRGFLVCKQLSKPWLLFYLRFPGLLFRRRRTLTTPYHNPATKQCPVHVLQMYLPLSLSWSIFHEFCHFPDFVEFNQDKDFFLKSQSSRLFFVHFTDCERKWENTQRLHACLIDQVVHFRKYSQLLSNRNCK